MRFQLHMLPEDIILPYLHLFIGTLSIILVLAMLKFQVLLWEK
jgi:hypothetical protein